VSSDALGFDEQMLYEQTFAVYNNKGRAISDPALIILFSELIKINVSR
jgi:hypothetical protein